jgi:hypothetical protein
VRHWRLGDDRSLSPEGRGSVSVPAADDTETGTQARPSRVRHSVKCGASALGRGRATLDHWKDRYNPRIGGIWRPSPGDLSGPAAGSDARARSQRCSRCDRRGRRPGKTSRAFICSGSASRSQGQRFGRIWTSLRLRRLPNRPAAGRARGVDSARYTSSAAGTGGGAAAVYPDTRWM